MSRLLFVLVGLTACSMSDPVREREVARVRAHLERAFAELIAAPVGDLTIDQRAQRAIALDHLDAYIVAESYPTNDVVAARTPIFIDHDGVRCAMAALIEQGGGEQLVERIARDHDYAYIEDLGADVELEQWLTEHGLSLREAARIQPGYDNRTSGHWLPTVSVEGGVQVGVRRDGDDDGAEATLPVGLRVGIRRIAQNSGACDQCTYRSTALVGEYQLVSIPNTGVTHQLALILQQELFRGGRDNQQYLLAGALMSIDSNAAPGDGRGLEAGFGASFRNRSVPFFGEVTVAYSTRPVGSAVHAGLELGLVW